MSTRTPLPEHPFSTAQARQYGIGRRALRHERLDRPFRGVRSGSAPETPLELAAQYLPKMAEHEFFSHVTSGLLLGLWLAPGLQRRMRIDVAVVKPPHRAPRDERVIGHYLVARPWLVVERHGLRCANDIETLCQLATGLGDDDLVIAAETLLPPHRDSSRVRFERIVAAFSDRDRPRSVRLGRVAARIRIGSRSPQETRTRLLIADAGLPEPCINLRWRGSEGITVEGDLVYPQQRVWIEVEGDQHRTDKRQWRNDVVRYERLTDLGWRVIRITADDLRLRPAETVERIRRALTPPR